MKPRQRCRHMWPCLSEALVPPDKIFNFLSQIFQMRFFFNNFWYTLLIIYVVFIVIMTRSYIYIGRIWGQKVENSIKVLNSIRFKIRIKYRMYVFVITCSVSPVFFPGTGDARDGDAFSQAKLQVSSYRDSVTRNNTQMSHETLLQVTHDSTICTQHYKYL